MLDLKNRLRPTYRILFGGRQLLVCTLTLSLVAPPITEATTINSPTPSTKSLSSSLNKTTPIKQNDPVRAYTIAGTLVDQYGQTWDGEATVDFFRRTDNTYATTPLTTTPVTKGNFSQSLPKGTYKLKVALATPNNAKTQEKEGIVLSDATPKAVVTVPLAIEYKQKMTGNLVGPSGEKLAGKVYIEPLAEAQSSMSSGTVARPLDALTSPVRDGQYVIGFRQPGTYRITVETIVTIPPEVPVATNGIRTLLEALDKENNVLALADTQGLADESALRSTNILGKLEKMLPDTKDIAVVLSAIPAISQKIEEYVKAFSRVEGAKPSETIQGTLLEATAQVLITATNRWKKMLSSDASYNRVNESILAYQRWLNQVATLLPKMTNADTLQKLTVQATLVVGEITSLLKDIPNNREILATTKATIETVTAWGNKLAQAPKNKGEVLPLEPAWRQMQRKLTGHVQHAVDQVALIIADTASTKAVQGIYEVVISRELVRESIKQAQQARDTFVELLRTQKIETYKNIVAKAIVSIEAPTESTEIKIKLSPLGTDGLKSLESILLLTPQANVTIDQNTFGSALANDHIALSIKKMERAKLSAKVQNKVPQTINPTDIRYSINGVPQVTLSGTIRLAFPYTPVADENPDALTAFFLSDNGLSYNRIGQYNTQTKHVEFVTNRASLYFVAPASKSFQDLSGYEWAASAIAIATGKGIINGRTNMTFHPAGEVSRATFASLLVRMLMIQTTNVTPLPFKDVNRKMWHAQDVAVAYYEGLMAGTSERLFEPDAPITRQEIATVLTNTVVKYGFTVAPPFTKGTFRDEDQIEEKRRSDLATMLREGIFQGNEFNAIRPQNIATRTEVAIMLNKLLQVITHS